MKAYNRKEREKVYRTMRRVFKNPTPENIEAEFKRVNRVEEEDYEDRLQSIQKCFGVNGGTGFCAVLEFFYESYLRYFPELVIEIPPYEQRYHADPRWWFKRGDYKPRIEILDRIISKMEGKKR